MGQRFEICDACEGQEGWLENNHWYECIDCEGMGGWWEDESVDDVDTQADSSSGQSGVSEFQSIKPHS